MDSNTDLHKTVFISYRREPSSYLALALFKQLHGRGYDVFWDIESIGAGQFEPIILGEIGRRAHFVLLLANRTLDRCSETGDWLRREVEYAMSLGRQIIPVVVDGFDLKENSKYLTGELNKLLTYNRMPLSIHYFDAGIDKLCNQFLTNKNYGEILEIEDNQKQVEQIIEEATNKPMPSQAELEAERLHNQGYIKLYEDNIDGAISDWNEAIRLNPNYDIAYSNRGAAKGQKEDYIGALIDIDKAIAINASEATFFENRGVVKYLIENFDEALADFDTALKLEPNVQSIYQNRVNVYVAKGELQIALAEQNKIIERYPNDRQLYVVRGDIYWRMGNLSASLLDLNRNIEIDPLHAPSLNMRGTVYQNMGKLDEAFTDYNNALDLKSSIEDTALIAILYSNRGEVNFLLKKFSRAIKDFETARKYMPRLKPALAGVIIAYHAQGQVKKARRMWQELVRQYAPYSDMDWLQKELNWADALIEEARKLVSDSGSQNQ